MSTLNAILVDDEFNSLENLSSKLTEFCPEINIVAQTQEPENAIKLIDTLKPEVLFLDIEMPRINGFTLLKEIKHKNLEIIFTTAYNHFAIDAIRLSAFDYLTKPISIDALQSATQRLQASKFSNTNAQLEILNDALNNPKDQNKNIALPTTDGFEMVSIADMIHLESSSSYTKIYFNNNISFLVSKPLAEFEIMLKDYQFFRVHHGHLINLKYVKKYLKNDGGQVVLKNDTTIEISRRKKDDFLKILKSAEL
jgi:two-component system, LytTR family, response regulator